MEYVSTFFLLLLNMLDLFWKPLFASRNYCYKLVCCSYTDEWIQQFAANIFRDTNGNIFLFMFPLFERSGQRVLFFKRYKGEETLLHSWHPFVTIDAIELQAVLNSTDFIISKPVWKFLISATFERSKYALMRDELCDRDRIVWSSNVSK